VAVAGYSLISISVNIFSVPMNMAYKFVKSQHPLSSTNIVDKR
jgi:hypothetical protein